MNDLQTIRRSFISVRLCEFDKRDKNRQLTYFIKSYCTLYLFFVVDSVDKQRIMIVYFVFMLLAICFSNGTFVTTDIETGQVRGYRIPTSSGGDLDIFLGIPFAEPPLGNLRFAPPQETKNWRPSVFNATTYGPACQQPLHFLQK